MKMMNKKGMHWIWMAAGAVGLLLLVSVAWFKIQQVGAPKFFP